MGMPEPLEVELKLEGDPADCGKLASLPLFDAPERRADSLLSTYFDTPDLHLKRNGFSLRVRQNGKHRLQTVKLSDPASVGLFVRPEWERRLKSDAPILDEASGPLLQTLGQDVATQIKPIFTTDIRRISCQIRRAGADIESAIDAGTVCAGDRVQPICEVELELKSGPAAALFDLARALNDAMPLRLGVRAKSECGYSLLQGDEPVAYKADPILLGPHDNAGTAFEAIAKGCIRHFRLNETPLIASGSVEALHQARVGLRRLRSVFSLYKPLLVGDERAESLRIELRRLAGLLGQVRNIDVLLPRVNAEARNTLIAARERAFEQVHADLVSSSTRLLMIDLVEWLLLGAWRTRGKRAELFHQNVVTFAEDLLEERRKRLKRKGKGLADLSHEHRHEVRIEAKKLRYATEFFSSLYGGKKRRRLHKAFLASLEKLQDQLGELNDLASGPTLLAELGVQGKLAASSKRPPSRLLVEAEKAYDDLMNVHPFWRA